MPFNLPPPWDAGFALPDNVLDEGLERRGFVTRMAPRGTYDDPKVGTGGYAVPKYVMKEGYGQGAYTTKWAPRGTYDIPVPNYLNARPQVLRERALPGGGTAVTMDALSGVDPRALPASYRNFGAKAAQRILQHVQRVPPAQRKAQLKGLLDSIDPTLWKRTAKLAEAHVRAGAPASQALQAGLATAMSTGIAAEVVASGKSGRAPRGETLLGLGCYRRSRLSAFGDAATPKALNLTSIAAPLVQAVQSLVSAPLQEGNCSADGKFIWKGGHWERKKATDVCTGSVNVTVDTRTGQGGGVTVTGADGKPQSTTVSAPPKVEFKMLQIGPFAVPLNAGAFRISWSQQLPAEWQGPILNSLSHDTGTVFSAMVDASPGKIWARLRDFVPRLPNKINQKFVGIRDGGGGANGKLVQSAEYPIVRTKRPDNGEDWGMFMTVSPRDPGKVWDSSSNPYVLVLEFKKIDKGFFAGIWDWIVEVVSKIVDVVGDALSDIADLACKLVSSPGGLAAGAAVGVATGVGASAGTAGAAVAQAACNMDQPPPQTAPAVGGESILPVVLIAGGALAAVALLTRKKKKTP